MKTLALEKTALAVRKAAYLAKGDVLVLTENGKPAFAVVGVNDEMALEALALGRNAEFMGYLDEVSARGGKKHSLKETQEEFGVAEATPAPKKRTRSR